MNVLVFVSDALRADHVGVYGADSVKTPTLDALADSGLRFEQAISAAPWTAPSMMSMVTGLYPARHGIVSNTMYDPDMDAWFRLSDRASVQNGDWWGARLNEDTILQVQPNPPDFLTRKWSETMSGSYIPRPQLEPLKVFLKSQ